jgi:hypothetical protein
VREVHTVLYFTIAPFATSDGGLKDQLNEVVGEATDVDNMNPAPSGVDDVTSVMNAVDTISTTWLPLVDKIRQFTDIVDEISEVWFKHGCFPVPLMPTGCLIIGSSVRENGMDPPVCCT